jgi:hypothetical protein
MTQRKSGEIPLLKGEGEDTNTINTLIRQHNFLAENISLAGNFSGQILEGVKFAAGEEKDIPHKLGIKPKHRIILNQEGNGVLSDLPSGWDKFKIKMKNNGAVAVVATIMIVKE